MSQSDNNNNLLSVTNITDKKYKGVQNGVAKNKIRG